MVRSVVVDERGVNGYVDDVVVDVSGMVVVVEVDDEVVVGLGDRIVEVVEVLIGTATYAVVAGGGGGGSGRTST